MIHEKPWWLNSWYSNFREGANSQLGAQFISQCVLATTFLTTGNGILVSTILIFSVILNAVLSYCHWPVGKALDSHYVSSSPLRDLVASHFSLKKKKKYCYSRRGYMLNFPFHTRQNGPQAQISWHALYLHLI